MHRIFISFVVLLLACASPEVYSQARKIDKNLYGINVERDSFMGKLYSNPTQIKGWLTDLGVGHIRTGIPLDMAQPIDIWTKTQWNLAADLRDTTGIKITFLWNTAVWPEGITTTEKNTRLERLKKLIAGDAALSIPSHVGKIAYYEIGNEIDNILSKLPNGSTPAVYQPYVARYKTYLTDVTTAIKSVDPGAKFIMTSCATSGTWGAVHQYMLQQGCGSLVDYYSTHRYPYDSLGEWYPTQSSTWPLSNHLVSLAQNMNTLVTNAGAPRRPFFMTEMGYALRFPVGTPASQLLPHTSARAQAWANEDYQNQWNTTRLFRIWAKDVQSIYPVERVDQFMLYDPGTPVGDSANQWGAISPTGTFRKQYAGLQRAFGLLDGAVYMNERSVGSTAKCYEFMKDGGRKVSIIWSGGTGSTSTTLPLGSATGTIYNADGTVNASPSNVASVSVSYSRFQKYLATGNGQCWKEAESPNWTNFGTPPTNTNSSNYNDKAVSWTNYTLADRQMSYVMNVPRAGTYRVWVSATPNDQTGWASPFKYAVNQGTSLAGNPTWVAGPSGAAARTGIAYGTSNALAWTRLGTFTTSGTTFPQSWCVTIRVHQPMTNGKSSFVMDAVYIEPHVP